MDRERMKQLIYRYENATLIVNRRMNSLMKDQMSDDMTIDQCSVLRYIANQIRATSSELADMFCVGKSSITAIITRLTDRGLLVRVPDEKDRRVVYLELSEAGKQAIEQTGEKIHQILGALLIHFTEEEARAFIDTYEKLATLLQQTEGSGEKG